VRIEASQVSYVTAHRSVSATAAFDETLGRAGTSGPIAVTAGVPLAAADTVRLSAQAGSYGASDREDLQDLDPKQRLAVLAIEALLGHRIRLSRSHPGAAAACNATGAQATAAAPAAASAPSTASTGEVHRRTELHYEKEQTSFQAQGVVDTADGRSIAFSVQLTMQREFQSYTAITGSVSTTDPLVVNFGGAPARLTGAQIAFDLNADGRPENISFVAGGSGFLVLDRNGDGKANDGRELFGPQTGNGFGELASYDADGNGWIDENDPVFSKLRIWTGDGLSTLSDKGIGALSTSSAETPFALKDGSNVLQGDVRSTGIYLSENGAVGTIQQVDLAEG
jgi:hypothetical protein